jgi:hypothetical protein
MIEHCCNCREECHGYCKLDGREAIRACECFYLKEIYWP